MTADTPAEPSVRFRDLGPLEVERAGAASPVGGAREEAPPGGSCFVDLTVATPERVPDTIASALELPAAGPVEPTDALRRFTSARRMLVVLDNCEHVLDAVAELVENVPGPRGRPGRGASGGAARRMGRDPGPGEAAAGRAHDGGLVRRAGRRPRVDPREVAAHPGRRPHPEGARTSLAEFLA
ncbi:MAG: hypothetical protein J0I34_23360 [Pseudonocardia sp.]|uniref:hypothetical protein n=1 Tax=unclassified Pseudonocardia TaxID=2619320 RepID=UPI0008698CCC|nr:MULTISPECIES: hypothetical protein [unclassified Pseudonocardia]MBN9111710.1 hypothetical protein [Pseudonocardia sp.]ODU25553.1 MAG: hypothetical protein ABS80_09850 [Pseudonocardia sp. SCN 72-51]ODV02295.1 MAG: hypothetical protein ABT15_25800 [Pseudonocardia sp. SCN 73-27]